MSHIAEFSLPADAFCLGDVFQTLPTVIVELDRLVAHSPDYVMPFIWVQGIDQESFDDALADDSTVAQAELSDSFSEALLYQVSWTDVVSDRLRVILDNDGTILEARGSEDKWNFRVRFGSRDHFADFREHFEEYGAVTLHQLKPPETPTDITYGVSAKQQDALLTAYDAGYYDTPRTASGEDLAQQLGISQQAVSMRLQRGVRTLLENTLRRHRSR